VGNARFPGDFFIDLFFAETVVQTPADHVVPRTQGSNKTATLKSMSSSENNDSVGATLEEINQMLGEDGEDDLVELDDGDFDNM